MFGALNRFIARLDSDPSAHTLETGPDDNSYGFQVLRNIDTDLSIEPWFDFIIGINGRLIDNPDPQLFATEVRNCAGHSLSLDIWSAKGQRSHTVSVALPASLQSLGLTLRLAPLNTTYNVWHVLSIPSSLSPAHLAGLLPHSDYIIGTPAGTLAGEAALGELVEDHLNRSLVLWVYNSEFDVVREVELMPRRGWGGEGALGAVLGFGALHRLPIGLGEEVQGPGEELFEAEQRLRPGNAATGEELIRGSAGAKVSMPQQPPPLVPRNVEESVPKADLYAAYGAALTGGAGPARGKKGRTRGGVSPNRAFDDIFQEGTKKSQEQDYPSSGRTASPVAPPPKVNKPPGISSPDLTRDPSPAPNAEEDIGEPGDAEAT